MTHAKTHFLVLILNSTAGFFPPFSDFRNDLCLLVFEKVHVLKMSTVGEPQMV